MGDEGGVTSTMTGSDRDDAGRVSRGDLTSLKQGAGDEIA